ncbi:MAG: DNA-binding response regulator [Deltaproteobacteria bacterium]|nr:MAG: DNA-binding response regulator [Deltaproteobacteria bacterium]
MSASDRISLFLVEDQAALLKALQKFLSTVDDLEVVGTALSGEEAVRRIPELGPDVVLLDLELPGMDGIEVLRHLKPACPECQVLILTTFDDETKVYEAMQAGASGYLVKRMATEKIPDAVREAHRGGVVIESRIARRFWNYFQSVRASPPEVDRCGLTDVELEVLAFIAKGLSNAEVGEVMQIDRRTVRTHLSHIYRKLGCNSHVQAVVKGLKLGLIDL